MKHHHLFAALVGLQPATLSGGCKTVPPKPWRASDGLYRWHITDPIRFQSDPRVTVQALGCQDGGRYLPLQDDISSVAFWYQTEPHAPFPECPPRDALIIQKYEAKSEGIQP